MAITTTIIFNPGSGSASQWDGWVCERERRPGTQVQRTETQGDATDFARRASEKHVERVISVGGDGTLNQTVNGLMAGPSRPELVPIPAGTGNDFATTLGSPSDPQTATRWLDEDPVSVPVDVFRVRWGHDSTWGINALHGGYAGRVSRDVDSDMKEKLGPLAYLAALPEARRNEPDYETHITWGDGQEEAVDAVDIVIANGMCIGGGFPVAHTAELDDGILDAVVVRAGSLLDLAGVAATLASGQLVESDYVIHRPIQSAEIETSPAMSFNIDGEPLDGSRVSGRRSNEASHVAIDVHPAALPVLRPPEDD